MHWDYHEQVARLLSLSGDPLEPRWRAACNWPAGRRCRSRYSYQQFGLCLWLSLASWLWRMLWQLGIIKVWLGFIWFVSLATRFCTIPFWFGPWVWCGHRLHDWDVNCLLFFGIYGLGFVQFLLFFKQ